MEAGNDEGTIRVDTGPVIGSAEEIGDKEQEVLRTLIPDVPVQQGAVDHVLKEKVFFLPGKGFSGKDSAIQGRKKLSVAGRDREPFDHYPVDIRIPSRVIIGRPIPFKILDTGRPDLYRNSPLGEIFYGTSGLGFSPTGDIRTVPRANKSDLHRNSSGLIRFLV